MNRRLIIMTTTLLLIAMLTVVLVGCSEIGFSGITHIKRFDQIDKIVVVQNNNISDSGNVSLSTVKTFEAEKDVLAIYNLLNRAKYRKEKEKDSNITKYVIRIYLEGESGYIEYNWDRSFVASNDFTGKVNEGFYSMDKADAALSEIEALFYRD